MLVVLVELEILLSEAGFLEAAIGEGDRSAVVFITKFVIAEVLLQQLSEALRHFYFYVVDVGWRR